MYCIVCFCMYCIVLYAFVCIVVVACCCIVLYCWCSLLEKEIDRENGKLFFCNIHYLRSDLIRTWWVSKLWRYVFRVIFHFCIRYYNAVSQSSGGAEKNSYNRSSIKSSYNRVLCIRQGISYCRSIRYQPHVDYCDTMYDSHPTAFDKWRLEKAQNRAARLFASAPRHTPTLVWSGLAIDL